MNLDLQQIQTAAGEIDLPDIEAAELSTRDILELGARSPEADPVTPILLA